MLLLDERPPPPDRPQLAPWEPNWRMWGWVAAAVAALAGASASGGFESYVLIVAALSCAAQAANRALPYKEGLREHRQ